MNDMKAPASSRATSALVLGILSITCTGLLTGIPAMILGSMELRAIKAGESPPAGEQNAKIGFVLGLVGTLLSALAILAFIAVIALGISLGASGVFNDIVKTSI